MSEPTRPHPRSSRRVRIGGASGFWGDSALATPQLLAVPGLQYLVYDYLAETTMAILARARRKRPELGYATDFVHDAMAPHLAQLLAQGVRVVANAGGLNPQGCADELARIAAQQGLRPRIAVLLGDDLMPVLHRAATDQGSAPAWHDLQGQPLPKALISANAYVGAQGIALALDQGADIVVTGRCVDSAVVLGVLAHEFGWCWDDWDRLAAATLAGHVIECGAQATGGLFTDWQQVPDWAGIGYPVIDVAEDGSFELGKPAGTGGLIHPGAVAEQVLYEVGDPAHYLMPDVSCDFRQVQVRALSADRVAVSGARGRPPTDTYKANGTWQQGYQIQVLMAIRGIEAPAKARKTAEALLLRTRRQLAQAGLDDYSETAVELLGCEALYGPQRQMLPTREVVLRLAARHAEARGLVYLQRECASAGTSMGPGTRSSFSGRAEIQPVIQVLSFLVPKTEVALQLRLGDQTWPVPPGPVATAQPAAPLAAAQRPDDPVGDPLNDDGPQGPLVSVPLLRLAWARSGDKGDDENIGVIARQARYLPLLRAQLTAEVVRHWLAHLVQGPVERHEVPGLQAFNFVLHQALGGGGVCSLRSDPLGKSFAQMLLDCPLQVPAAWLD